MKLRSLSAALVLAGFSAAAMQANAEVGFPGSGPVPDLKLPEKSVFIGLESVLSALAAAIEAGDCKDYITAAGFGVYNVKAEAEYDGLGYAQLDQFAVDVARRDGTSINKGELWDVYGTGYIAGEPVTGYVGSYGTDKGGSMLYGSADMWIHKDRYDEHIIKDFWDYSDDSHKVVLDDGLELITKQDYPRAKWFQTSYYERDNGGDGTIHWYKTQIAPDGANVGTMTLSMTTDGFGDGLETFDGFLILECYNPGDVF